MRIFLATVFAGVAMAADHASTTDFVRPYSSQLEKESWARAPYAAVFENNKAKLVYIASNHINTTDKVTIAVDPTVNMIRKALESLKPDAVIVEGVGYGTPEDFTKKRVRECEDRGFQGCSETDITLSEALKKHIAFFSGEPDPVFMKNKVLKSKIDGKAVSQEDLLGFFMVRQIPQYVRQGKVSGAELSTLIPKEIERFQRQYEIDAKFSTEDFMKWYAKNGSRKMKNLDDFKTIDKEDTAPKAEGTLLQKISHEIGNVRDPSVVSVIEKALQGHKRILVVYGASHLLTQEPAIEHLLGKPSYTLNP